MSRILFFRLSPKILVSAVLASGLTVTEDKKASAQQQQPLTPITKTDDQGPMTLVSFDKGCKININVTGFKSILEKVKDLPVVVYSINGRSRTGKSYLLENFVRLLQHEVDPSLPSPTESAEWLAVEPDKIKFKWATEDDPTTKGIQVWSEPFVVTRGGEKVAVILLDCQGLYDKSWPGFEKYQNFTILSISYLLSSVSIYNFKKIIDEQLLRHITSCSEYGRIQYKNFRDQDHHLILLLRDWKSSKYENFRHGYHQKQAVKYTKEGYFMPKREEHYVDPTNYHSHFFNFYRLDANKYAATMQALFQNLTIYLMPDPGPDFNSNGFRSPPSGNFPEHLKRFICLLNSELHAVPKKFLGDVMTGKTMQRLIDVIALNFTRFDDIPKVQDFLDSFIQYHSVSTVMDWVEETGDNWKKQNPRRVPEEKINEFIAKVQSEAMERLNKEMIMETEETRQKNRPELDKIIQDFFERLKTHNSNNKS